MKRLREVTVSVILMLIISILCGCEKNNKKIVDQTEPETETTVILESTTVGEAEIVVTVPENQHNYIGMYSSDEAKIINGIFLAYEDGSYDRYVTGGYCNGLTKTSTDFDGYYASNAMLEEIPAVITELDTLVVFSDKNFNITLHPINYEVGAITAESDDGVMGFGHCSYLFNDSMNVSIHYSNHDSEVKDVLYVDGVLPSEYPMEITDKIVHPYKGMKSKEEVARYYSFPRGGMVSLGTAKGTSIIEKTYEVDAIYFDLHVNRNEWDVVDYYILDYKPTPEGYAKIEMHDSWQGLDVPAGKYVMVYKTDSTYRASIINWQGK